MKLQMMIFLNGLIIRTITRYDLRVIEIHTPENMKENKF